MAGLKRRNDVDLVSDDFSDFSLSSPATKIRRLDAELPPIAEMEEEMEQEEPISQQHEELKEDANPNEERALVLFNPLPRSPFSFSLHSNIFSGIKNWSKQYDSDCDRLIRSQQQEEEQAKKNQLLALVPWVPSSSTTHVDDSNTEEEADEIGEAASMDVEEQDHTIISDSNVSASNLHHAAVAVGGITATPPPEGFHQWQQQQQQHCLLPQFPQNTSTPITFTWTR